MCSWLLVLRSLKVFHQLSVHFICVKIFWLKAALPLRQLPLVFKVTYKMYHKMSFKWKLTPRTKLFHINYTSL